jgi:hypothetical protein
MRVMETESSVDTTERKRITPAALILFVATYSLVGYFVVPSFVGSYSRLGPGWLIIPLAVAAVLIMINGSLNGRLTPTVDAILGAILILALIGLWLVVSWKSALKGVGYAVGWAILTHYGAALLIAVIALVRRDEPSA